MPEGPALTPSSQTIDDELNLQSSGPPQEADEIDAQDLGSLSAPADMQSLGLVSPLADPLPAFAPGNFTKERQSFLEAFNSRKRSEPGSFSQSDKTIFGLPGTISGSPAHSKLTTLVSQTSKKVPTQSVLRTLSALPDIPFAGSVYTFERYIMTQPGEELGVFFSEGKAPITVKLDDCSVGDRCNKILERLSRAIHLSSDMKKSCTLFCEGCAIEGSFLRAPVQLLRWQGCLVSLYEGTEQTLRSYLDTQIRNSEEIERFFLQILSLLRCLHGRSLHIQDLSVDSFVVVRGRGGLKLALADIGDLSEHMPTQSIIPPVLLHNYEWSKRDELVSLLLAQILFEMLLVNGQMAQISRCMRLRPAPDCAREFLSSNTAPPLALGPGLKQQDPKVQALWSIGLMLFGVVSQGPAYSYLNIDLAPSEIFAFVRGRAQGDWTAPPGLISAEQA